MGEHLETLAQEAAGNWQRFDSFAWFDQPADPRDWTIYYTSHRDSGLLAKSNEAQIDNMLEPYLDKEPCDVREEYHNHWAVGSIQGYAIRVYRDAKITDAFKRLYQINERLEAYPVLNEEDYSRKEYEATLENIEQAAWRYNNDAWPEDWVSELHNWFCENDQSAIENTDDQGGWPSDEHLAAAIEGLGWRVEI